MRKKLTNRVSLYNVGYMIKIIALVSCHNRLEKTKKFLNSFYALDESKLFSLNLHLLDDGSNDGTGKYIEKYYPSVQLYYGDGSYYWAGGMRYLYEQVKNQYYDYLLMVNDDIVLDSKAIINTQPYIVKAKESSIAHAIVGNCVKPENHTEHSYGGLKYIRLWFGYRFLMASLEDKIVDTMNMNFCLISKEAVNAIGFLDPVFRHQRADLDYGLRLRAYGGIIYNITSPVCLCDRNEFESNSYSSNTSYFKKIRSIFSIKEQPVKERFVFYRRYGGWAWIIGFMAPYFTVFMPFFHTLCKRLSVRKTGRLL